MNEMVERVARAITEAFDREGRVFDGGQAGTLAIAAIEALREPTDRMLNSGAARWDDDLCTETNALNMWNGMIDEALK